MEAKKVAPRQAKARFTRSSTRLTSFEKEDIPEESKWKVIRFNWFVLNVRFDPKIPFFAQIIYFKFLLLHFLGIVNRAKIRFLHYFIMISPLNFEWWSLRYFWQIHKIMISPLFYDDLSTISWWTLHYFILELWWSLR